MTEHLDLDELRAVAEQATPGNWMWVNDREEEHIRAGKFPYKHVAYTEYVEDENALHIATFDPPTVLALIERVQAAEAKLERVQEVASGWATLDRPFREAILRALDGGDQPCSECDGTGEVAVEFNHGVQMLDCGACGGGD